MVTHDIEEAVHLSTKLVVMAPRPGRIRKLFDIDAPHPRDRSSRDFIALKERIARESSSTSDSEEPSSKLEGPRTVRVPAARACA